MGALELSALKIMNNFKLSANISTVNWSDEELKNVEQQLLKLDTDDLQGSFYRYCLKWKLAPLCYSQLKKHNLLDAIHDEERSKFEAEYEKIKDQNTNRTKRAVEILKAFQDQQIDVIVLKGNYLAHEVYEDIAYKKMNDFDILIKKEDWEKIQSIYLEMGYIPLGFGWSGEKETPAKFSHVGMAFISPDLTCIIGSQWGLKSPTAGYNVDINQAWETASNFNFSGVESKSLSVEFNLLHLMLHMGIYKCGIRDCMDIYNLARVKNVDLNKLSELIHVSEMSRKARFTLVLSNFCAAEFEPKFIDSIASSNAGYTNRRLKGRVKVQQENGDFQSSYIDYFQDIEKQVINFALFPKFHKKLPYYFKILRLVYLPKTAICLKLNDKYHRPTRWNKIVARIKAPHLTFALIAQEIGWKFTILLFMKLFLDLLISIKNYVVRKDSYFDYLKQKGIDPMPIQKIVDDIQ